MKNEFRSHFHFKHFPSALSRTRRTQSSPSSDPHTELQENDPHTERISSNKREREIANPKNPRSSHHWWVALPHEPEIVAPWTHELRVTPRQSHRRVALRTHEPQVAPHRSHRQVASRTHKPVTDLVLVLVWNFCNKILWFWFFTFPLWSLIFLLLLWWCGWWCFGGFPVVWWWKIAFSEFYQTHENIF